MLDQDFPGPINSEAHPISVHLLPVILCMMEHLGSEKCCRSIALRAKYLLSPDEETGPDRGR